MTDVAVELSDEEQFAALRSKTSEPEKPTAEAVIPEPVTPEPEAAPPDPYAGWPDTAKAELEKARAEAKKLAIERDAAVGRLAPIQRKLSDLERSSVAPKANPVPAKPAPSNKRDSYFDSPEWKEFERDYPDEAKRQRNAIASERAAILEETRRIAREEAGAARDELGRFVSPYVARMEEVEQRERVAVLNKEHPDWHEHFMLVPTADGSYEPKSSPAFDAWFDQLDAIEQDDVRDRLWATDRPDLCAWVIRKFKRETAIDSAANNEAAQKAESRRKNLEANVSPNLKPSPAAVRINPDDLSDEDRFALIREQRKR
jgi:hypothetical protein